MQSHQWSVVKYCGYHIFKCHLGCLDERHYHCISCSQMMVKTDRFFKHISTCCNTTTTTAPTTSMVTPAPTTALVTPALATALVTPAPMTALENGKCPFWKPLYEKRQK